MQKVEQLIPIVTETIIHSRGFNCMKLLPHLNIIHSFRFFFKSALWRFLQYFFLNILQCQFVYTFLTRVFFSWILQKLLYGALNFLQIFIKEFFKNFLRGFLLRNKFRSDLPWSYLPNTRFLLANSSKGFFKNFYLGNLIFLKSSTRNSSKISSRFSTKKQTFLRSSMIFKELLS